MRDGKRELAAELRTLLEDATSTDPFFGTLQRGLLLGWIQEHGHEIAALLETAP